MEYWRIPIEKLNQRPKTAQFISDQSGQAIVEYILLLVVVIAIATLAATKLFNPAKKWADFYLFDYTYCMLDQGELPTMAGGNPQECEELAAAAGYGSSGKGSGGKDGKDDTSSSEKNSLSDSSSSGSGGSESSAALRRRRAGRSVSRNSSDRGADANQLNTAIEVDPGGEGGGGRQRMLGDISNNAYQQGQGRGRRMPYRGFAGALAEEKERIEKREERISGPADESRGSGQNRKIAMRPPEKVSKKVNTDLGGFNLGDWLRYIIIAGILGIIIYVMTSQLNSIVKSMEK